LWPGFEGLKSGASTLFDSSPAPICSKQAASSLREDLEVEAGELT
jgi:hypothetical protein